MAKIDHELYADHQALTLFGQAARRVLAADRDRLMAVHENDPYLTFSDKRAARNRMRDNYAFIQGTFADLERRIAAYDYAVDRTRIETPGVAVASVEGSLNHLRERAASMRYELSQSYSLAESEPEYRPPQLAWQQGRDRRAPLDLQPRQNQDGRSNSRPGK